MTQARFDELIHAPTRLGIVSLLAAAEWADFKFIRDELGLSDSALSKQLTSLETAGYVEIRKAFVGKRPQDVGETEPIGPRRVPDARRGAAADHRPLRRRDHPHAALTAPTHRHPMTAIH